MSKRCEIEEDEDGAWCNAHRLPCDEMGCPESGDVTPAGPGDVAR